MNLMNGELERLVTDATELKHQVAAIADDIDYQERTRATPDPRMRTLSDSLSRIVDGLDDHRAGLENLVAEESAAGRLPAMQSNRSRRR